MTISRLLPGFDRLIASYNSPELYDWFFNARTGYRAQFWIDPETGAAFNSSIVDALREVLRLRLPAAVITVRCIEVIISGFSREDRDVGAMEVTRDELAKSLSPAISKICIGERLYSVRGEPVAEIGKAVLLEAARSPAKLDVPRWAEARHPKGEKGEGLRAPFPDLEDSWLDLKGGFLDGEGKTSQFHPGALNCLDIGHRQIRTPLFAAGWRNDTALIKLLVESGASVSHEGDGMSPLAAAVGFGNAEAGCVSRRQRI
jgi:hypothetical protein